VLLIEQDKYKAPPDFYKALLLSNCDEFTKALKSWVTIVPPFSIAWFYEKVQFYMERFCEVVE
jgi:hypothetical protein